MKKRLLLILGIILLVFLSEHILSVGTPLFKQLELLTYDLRAKLSVDSGPFGDKFKHVDKKIVIVAIDDYSSKEIAKNPQLDLGSFPWRRDVWGGLVDFIEQGKPKAILFDLLFSGLNDNSWNDRRFAYALRKYDNVALATSLNNPKYLVNDVSKKSIVNSDFSPAPKSLNVKIDNKQLDDSITFYSHAPVHDIYTTHNTMAVVNKVVGEDSVIRKSQPLFKLNKNGEIYYMPSLAFAGFLKYMGEGSDIVVKNGKLTYKGRVIPIDNQGQTNISWHGSGKDYEYVPISKVLLSEDNEEYIKPDYFKDKIVIVGRTEAGTDIHGSSVNPSYAGPEANATAIDNFINDTSNTPSTRKFVSQLPGVFGFLLVVVSCLIIAAIGYTAKNALIGFLNSFILIILYVAFSVWIFANPAYRIWIPIVVPLYYLIMTAAIVFAFKFQKELAKRASVMNMFGKFVSPKILATLLKDSDNLVLKNTRKPITVMFCDVKDFTTLSEKSNPEQLVEGLNELFNEIVNVIFENNGTVDKFIGDCVMAYWGDPIASEDDSYMAIKTALDIKKKVNELKIKNAKEGKIILDVKMGINSGEALLGLSGSEKIMSYTAMGDAVNVASRLESNCSKLKRDILISQATYEAAKEKIVVLEAGKISVKGRDEEIEVYEPIGLAGDDTEETANGKA